MRYGNRSIPNRPQAERNESIDNTHLDKCKTHAVAHVSLGRVVQFGKVVDWEDGYGIESPQSANVRVRIMRRQIASDADKLSGREKPTGHDAVPSHLLICDSGQHVCSHWSDLVRTTEGFYDTALNEADDA